VSSKPASAVYRGRERDRGRERERGNIEFLGGKEVGCERQ